MAKKRPQLNLDELLRVKWLLGGLLALIALPALVYLDLGAWWLMVAGFLAVPLVLWRPELPARVPAWAHRLAFPGMVVFAVADFQLHGELFAAGVRLAALLLLYRACGYRRRRDDLQLIVLGLFLVVVAGVLTVSLAFAVQITVFTACALLLMLVVTLVEAHEGGTSAAPIAGDAAPAWTRLSWGQLASRLRVATDWRLFVSGGLLFGGFVLLAAALFLAIPRFQLESGFFLDRLLTKKSTTGFTDTLKFGDVVSIQQDNSVALRVEISDRSRLPAALYWRMVVLDEYRNGTFQMSAALKKSAFEKETTASRVRGVEGFARGGDATWTFYLESGVSRYLPLAGSFRRISFTEPQVFRSSPSLQLVMLSRDPVSMKAYRVEGMNASGVLRDFPTVANGGSETADYSPRSAMLELSLSERDRATLDAAVNKISGGATLSAKAFADAAMRWLARRHGYSLEVELLKGEGDPLVRWLASDQPGHCELFAGSFALLARAAGHPARVVAGFMGGTWNDDYLMVRNSNAHAWCEIADGKGGWFRADPTNDGPLLLAGGRPGEVAGASNLRTGAQDWSSRLDRLRILWYRRIVNFDRGDQLELVRVFKIKAEESVRQLRTWLKRRMSGITGLLTQPWDLKRWGLMAGLAGALAASVWTFWRFGPGWWRRMGSLGRGRKIDPVRREAGRWLRRLREKAGSEEQGAWMPEMVVVQQDLLRLRYGRRESWTETERVFREARRVVKMGGRKRVIL